MSLKAEVEEGWEMQQQSDSSTCKLIICFAGRGVHTTFICDHLGR